MLWFSVFLELANCIIRACKNNRDKEKVNEWLIEHQQNCIIQFSFGPGNTYVACTPQGACKWSSSLSPSVKRNIYRFHPVVATLGVGDAYVLVDGEGKFKWNLKGRYDQLDQILTKSDLAIEMVVLNPYAEKQYIIIFKTGTWRALLPFTYLDKIKEMLQKQDESDCQIIAMQTRAMEQNQRIAIQGMQNIMTMNANALSNLFIQ